MPGYHYGSRALGPRRPTMGLEYKNEDVPMLFAVSALFHGVSFLYRFDFRRELSMLGAAPLKTILIIFSPHTWG